MGKFKEKMEQFMRGRYGTDQLNNAMLVLCFILMVSGMFVKSGIFSVFTWVILILTIFRSLSRNGYKRRLENDRFTGIWNKVKAELFLTMRRIKDIKAYRYRKCNHCKAILRLPRKVGKHTVQCPRCHKEFKVHVVL